MAAVAAGLRQISRRTVSVTQRGTLPLSLLNLERSKGQVWTGKEQLSLSLTAERFSMVNFCLCHCSWSIIQILQ